MLGKVYIADTAMITSLGQGVDKNLDALVNGESGVNKSTSLRVTQSSVTAGLIPEEIYDELERQFGKDAETRAELLAIACIDALKWNPDVHTGLVIASAKGNIALIENKHYADAEDVKSDASVMFGSMGEHIASRFGIERKDIFVISNACISGVSAIAAARRMILAGRYSQMIVVGVDVQNRFITSGFASFKSLSSELCRPYDASRCGLNLGEACGAMLLTAGPVNDDAKCLSAESKRAEEYSETAMRTEITGQAVQSKTNPLRRPIVSIDGGAMTDDANHISGPSRTGDGLFFAMRKAMEEAGVTSEQIDVLQMHGTATAYNDEMESKAVALAGLESVPAQSLKPYFGHTMGASGIIETIILAEEMRRGIFVGTKGFETLGVPMPVNVSSENRNISGDGTVYGLKTASGFGGTNAAVLLTVSDATACGDSTAELFATESCVREKSQEGHSDSITCASVTSSVGTSENESYSNEKSQEVLSEPDTNKIELASRRTVEISSGKITVDGNVVFESETSDFQTFIREAFKSRGESNLKFYKMDDLCKLGYVASAWALDGLEYGEEECGLILSGRYGCLDTDIKHQEIIDTEGDASASPAVFVYTLPNVVAGEISIRHHIKGENTWFWSDDETMSDIRGYAGLAILSQNLKYCVVGHLDFLKGEYFAKFEVLAPAEG